MEQTKKKKPSVVLNNKLVMPLLGLGLFKVTDESTILLLFRKAFKAGYTLIDTARFYNNEWAVGRALKICYEQERIKRDELFLVTKTWNDSKLNLVKELKNSLQNLQTNYVDLYLLHWPICALDEMGNFQHKQIHQAWAEMEECVRKGYARSIGVSNFNAQNLMDLLSYCKIKPVVNQIQCHLYLPSSSLVELCQKMGVHVMAHSPLARGLSTNLDSSLLKQEAIVDIASKYGKTPGQVALKYLVAKNIIAIPKTENPQRLPQNIDLWSFELVEDDLKKLKALSKGIRCVNPKKNQLFSYLPIFD